MRQRKVVVNAWEELWVELKQREHVDVGAPTERVMKGEVWILA